MWKRLWLVSCLLLIASFAWTGGGCGQGGKAVPSPAATNAIVGKGATADEDSMFKSDFMNAEWLTPKEQAYLRRLNDTWLRLLKEDEELEATGRSKPDAGRTLELVHSVCVQASAWRVVSSPSTRMLSLHRPAVALMKGIADVYRLRQRALLALGQAEQNRILKRATRRAQALPGLGTLVIQAAAKLAQSHPPDKSTPTPTPTHKATHKATPKPKPTLQWYRVGMLFSSNHMETRSGVFTLGAKPTRADWVISPKTPHYNCTMFLIPASDTPDSTNATFITTKSSGGADGSNSSGKQVIHVEPGRYYIWATSNNCLWQVIILQAE